MTEEFKLAKEIQLEHYGCSYCEDDVECCFECDKQIKGNFYCDGFGEHICKECKKKK